MTTLESVESQVRLLATDDYRKFRDWFSSFDADSWDDQIEADASAGKLDLLAHEALQEYNSGKSREL